jgi:hypothetical protein
MASVTHKVNADGDHAIGVVVGGTFVPFVKLPAATVTLLTGFAAPANTFGEKKEKADSDDAGGGEGDSGDDAETDNKSKEG